MRINLPASAFLLWRISGERATGSTNKIDKQREEEKLLAACREFEALFWHQVLRQMRRTIPRTGLLDGGTAEEIFQDFLDGEYARTLAQQGPGTLAQMLYEQLRSSLSPAGE